MMNLIKNMVLAHSALHVGLKMSWRFRLGGLDRLVGPDDESDEKDGTGSQLLACRFKNVFEGQAWQA